MKVRNKKIIYTIIGIISVLLVAIAITYAYWLITKNQTGENIISSACLAISLTDEENDITLANQFPLSDEDGASLTPYTFTVTNNCNTSVDYQIALETFEGADSISPSAIKVMIDSDSPMILGEYEKLETRIANATNAYLLKYGTLTSKDTEGSSVSHSLRLWIDEDAPISEMKKTLISKISVTIGQGVQKNPYQKGTLAYEIIYNNGDSEINEIIENDFAHRSTPTYDQIVLRSNYYGTKYVYEDGKYTLSGTLTQATLEECRNGTKTCGKYTLKSTNSADRGGVLYEVTDFQNNGDYISVNIIKYTNLFGTAGVVPSLNRTTDEFGDSYYFRGATTNNYVEFGSYAEGSEVNGTTYNVEKPMYWRIVRINGDGTIRLVYDGIEKVENGVSHTATIAGSSYNARDDETSVGYTYDKSVTDTTQKDSIIKGVLDTWYDKHLESAYGKFIADSVFCNDREEKSYRYIDWEYVETEDPEAAAYIDIYYAPYERLSQYPKLMCTNRSDRYTVDNTTSGNGFLNNPIGLLTADEVVMAGGSNINQTYYLYSGEYFWTSTPAYYIENFNDSMYGPYVYSVGEDGKVSGYLVSFNDSGYYISDEFGVRPVINLRADVLFEGNGTIDTPYKIITE